MSWKIQMSARHEPPILKATTYHVIQHRLELVHWSRVRLLSTLLPLALALLLLLLLLLLLVDFLHHALLLRLLVCSHCLRHSGYEDEELGVAIVRPRTGLRLMRSIVQVDRHQSNGKWEMAMKQS
jgi:hypothetical protein